MAVMIPDRMPSGASMGEKELFSILQRLPDDCIVYYEPIIENRYPDFVVVCPSLGIMTIEVKGWDLNKLVAADSQEVKVLDRGVASVQKHPTRQARDYKFKLMDFCRESRFASCLLREEGAHQGRFGFPFGHFVLLSNITRTQLEARGAELNDIFPMKGVVTRETLLQWRENPPTEDEVLEFLRLRFDPFWPVDPPLSQQQMNAIRAALHPEILLWVDAAPKLPPGVQLGSSLPAPSVAILDLKQEGSARSIGEGHRIIYGVAGSGKTVLLGARAKLLSQSGEKRVLMVCYNVTLAAVLYSRMSDCSNVEVCHFDRFAAFNGVRRLEGETNEALGERLLVCLNDGAPYSGVFDAVLVDEAQDFAPSWFRCLLTAMKDPQDGDLVIVADGCQSLYQGSPIVWSSLGIKARGRTYNAKFDLNRNYRNSKEIVMLAERFASAQLENDDDESIASIRVSSDAAKRVTGIKPRLMQCSSRLEEYEGVLNLVADLLAGKWFGRTIEQLQPRDIGVLYPRVLGNERPDFERFVRRLADSSPTVWVNDYRQKKNRFLADEPAIKVQTIHSAKGLQYKAVLLLHSDHCPAAFGGIDPAAERKLFYVGLTRAEDYLVVLASATSAFVKEVATTGFVD